MKKLVIAMIAFGLAACASGPPPPPAAGTWLGMTEEQLVAGLGTPDSFYPAPNGDRILTYERQRVQYGVSRDLLHPGFGLAHGGLGYGYGYYLSPYEMRSVEVRRCAVSFTIRQTRVSAYEYRGDDCRYSDVAAAPNAIQWNGPGSPPAGAPPPAER
ncbi:MAG: hypothetical protein AB7G39_13095 [Alphaproteobacteria bacterium]